MFMFKRLCKTSFNTKKKLKRKIIKKNVIDQVQSLFNCDICNELGGANDICIGKRNLDRMIENQCEEKSAFKCVCCNNSHSIPKEGFQLKNELSSLDI